MFVTHTKQKRNTSPKPARWICRILPSGHFSAGRIPPQKERYHYNPALIDFQRKICITRCYGLDGYDCTTNERVYYQRRVDDYVMGTSPPNPNEILRIHNRRHQSSETTPQGLTDAEDCGISEPLGLGGVNGGSALGLSSVPSSRKRCPQGLKGITRYGRTIVREGCCVLTKQYKKHNLGFYTLTLPYRGEALQRIVCNWSKLVNRYFEELGRAYERRGAKLEYVAVVEIQEKRYNRLGEVAPHLHYVANARLGKNFILTHLDIRSIFKMVCERFVSANVDWEGVENCQVVRKDAGRYLSKYFSKGGKILENIAKEHRELLPKRWHKVSPSIKLCVKADTCCLYDSEVWAFIRCTQARKDLLPSKVVCEEVYVKVHPHFEMLVGYWGRVESLYDRV